MTEIAHVRAASPQDGTPEASPAEAPGGLSQRLSVEGGADAARQALGHFTAEPPSGRVQDLARFRLPDAFRGRGAVTVQLWWIVQGTLFALSPQFMYGWRNALLRAFGARIGRDVLVRPSVRITYPWKVSIGDRSWIGDNAELYSLGPITIGADAVVSQKSYLCTGSHDHRAVGFDIWAKPIVVEDEAWVAADVFVHPGVTVGRGAVIAARSTLTRNAKPYGLYVGAPAELKGRRTARGEAS